MKTEANQEEMSRQDKSEAEPTPKRMSIRKSGIPCFVQVDREGNENGKDTSKIRAERCVWQKGDEARCLKVWGTTILQQRLGKSITHRRTNRNQKQRKQEYRNDELKVSLVLFGFFNTILRYAMVRQKFPFAGC